MSAGHAKIVKLLLDTAEPSGADKLISNHEDDNGEAPIHLAARCGNLKIMKLLCAHGAQLDFVDRRGRTCLHCAAGSGHASCLEFALDFGADEFIEVKQDNGYTSLHLAIRANSTECVDILLQAGADPEAETSDGSNAYELASRQKSQSIMKLLLEYDVLLPDYSGSYSDGSLESSISGENMFRGLNTYNVTPAPKNFLPRLCGQNEQTPSSYFTAQQTPGRLFSPQLMSPSLTMASYGPPGLFNQGLLSNYPYSNPGSILQTTEVGYDESQFALNGDVWTICYTDDGYPYYFNLNTSVSTWDDPRIVLGQELENLPQHAVTASTLVVAEHNSNQSCQDNHIRSMLQTQSVAHKHMTEVKSSTAQEMEKNDGETPSASDLDVKKGLAEELELIQPRNNLEVTGRETDDSRVALIDKLKKQKPQESETVIAVEETAANQHIEYAKKSTIDDTTQDPHAAIMGMIKKKNSLGNDKDFVKEENAPSETLLVRKLNNNSKNNGLDQRASLVDVLKKRPASTETEADKPNENLMPEDQADMLNTDPRAAMMAMLQKRNPGYSNTQSSKSVNGEKYKNATEELNREKSLSNDELMKDPVLQKYMKMASFGVSNNNCCEYRFGAFSFMTIFYLLTT